LRGVVEKGWLAIDVARIAGLAVAYLSVLYVEQVVEDLKAEIGYRRDGISRWSMVEPGADIREPGVVRHFKLGERAK
jgi:hypothetical protein